MLSHGGCEYLENKLIDEKRKKKLEEGGNFDIMKATSIMSGKTIPFNFMS